ncbi:cell envelope integrity protein CreD [Lentilitoribacter sp. EG35]|uniref:cell envelope integrity protein CreD n=1 Tax=Lentilitoribacter sp. EG35 TaxID=3234192 RepID=UPI0034613D3D
MSDSEGQETAKNSQKPAQTGTDTKHVKPGTMSGLTQTPGWKFIVTGVITLLLTIPALLVWGLVEERADRANQVANSISQGWGQAQRINGPYLVVPYLVTEKHKDKYIEVRRHAIYSPDLLENTSDLVVEERKKAIYSTPLYHMKSTLSGKFAPIDTSVIISRNGRPRLNEAFLAVEVSDPTGFRSEVMASINNDDAGIFKPGLKGVNPTNRSAVDYDMYNPQAINAKSSGIHLPIAKEALQDEMQFEIKLAINGSRGLQIVPSGKTTKLAVQSNWPHPGFDGQFLPETRNITEDGFDANWTIPNLARGMSAVSLSDTLSSTKSVIKIGFVKPLKFYQLVSRTLKYAIAFFSLVFLSIFILEIAGKQSVHWIQYILTGLTMVVFYILLLALAEHIGFEFAYLIAATATTALVSWYVGTTLKSKNAMWLLTAIIGMTYAIMYLILKEDKYALLIGSIIAFAAIAVTMYATRNIDWSNGRSKEARTN